WSWRWVSALDCEERTIWTADAHRAGRETAFADGAKTNRVSPLAKIALGFVRLDYSSGVVQQADNCPAQAREGAVLRIRDRVMDRVGSCIPDPAVSKLIAD